MGLRYAPRVGVGARGTRITGCACFWPAEADKKNVDTAERSSGYEAREQEGQEQGKYM